MRTFYKLIASIGFVLLFSLGINSSYGAARFPEKAITLIVHAGPGGGSDMFARALQAGNDKDKLLPKPIIVENKPGGSGAIAFTYVAGKKKDPYFLLTSVSSIITTPLLGLTPITYKDFTPIANFAFDEFMLIVNVNSKFKSLKDIVAAAKANPQKVTVGGTMPGSAESIATYLIEKAAGVKLNYLGYTGSSESVVQLLGGHIDMTICNPGEGVEMVKANKVRILGVFTEKRLVEAPDAPTFKEQGLNVVMTATFRGLCAPKDIPQDARKVLEEALFKYTKTGTFKKYLKDNMLSEAWMDGPTFGKRLEEWNASYEAIYREMGVLGKKK
jgi:putative tricarboxylic transport membrane protein